MNDSSVSSTSLARRTSEQASDPRPSKAESRGPQFLSCLMLNLNASPDLTQQERRSRNRTTGHVCNLPGDRRVTDARPEGPTPKLGAFCAHTRFVCAHTMAGKISPSSRELKRLSVSMRKSLFDLTSEVSSEIRSNFKGNRDFC